MNNVLLLIIILVLCVILVFIFYYSLFRKNSKLGINPNGLPARIVKTITFCPDS